MSTTAADIAQQTGIAESTIRAWTRQYHVKGKKNGNKRIYPDNAADVFATIKNLKEIGSGQSTIQRKISAYTEVPEKSLNENASDIAIHITHIVQEALTKSEGLAEKYARATYQIGQLEAEKQALNDRLAALPALGDIFQLQAENKRLQDELTLMKNRGFLAWLKKLFG